MIVSLCFLGGSGKMPPKKLTKSDVVLFFAIAFLEIMLLLRPFSADTKFFSVNCDGEVQTYPLSVNQRLDFVSNGYSYSVLVQDGCVSVESADCPDKVCVATGEISGRGGSVICLPGHFVVSVTEADDADYILG